MAMDLGAGGGGVKSEINITPLVDVVLVLLIIFMIVTPLLQMGHVVDTPPKVENPIAPPPGEQVILRMDANGTMFINKQAIPVDQFPARLQEVLLGRENKMAFFAADGDLPFEKVAEFLDLCRNSGADNLGIVFDDIGDG